MHLRSYLKNTLEEYEKSNSQRLLKDFVFLPHNEIIVKGLKAVNFCSNDYLGFRDNNSIKNRSIEFINTYGTSSSSSRLVCGNLKAHQKLEKQVVKFKNTEAALVYSSGYAANLGVISALLNKNDLILTDRLDHASIIDACKLSGAKHRRFKHKNLIDLEELLLKYKNKVEKILVTSDAVFSMDGDISDLDSLKTICDKYGAFLLIDEAHATGTIGSTGRGLSEISTQNPDIYVGTFSKSLASQGGFVAGSQELIDVLINESRSFIYSTGLNPAACGAALEALELIEEDSTHVQNLKKNCDLFSKLSGLDSPSPIFPIIIGENDYSLRISNELLEEGFFIQAIRPPTVAIGQARLRITISASHTDTQIIKLCKLLKKKKIL